MLQCIAKCRLVGDGFLFGVDTETAATTAGGVDAGAGAGAGTGAGASASASAGSSASAAGDDNDSVVYEVVVHPDTIEPAIKAAIFSAAFQQDPSNAGSRGSGGRSGVAVAAEDTGVRVHTILERMQQEHPKFGKLRRDRLQVRWQEMV